MSKRISKNDIKREAFIQLPKWLFEEDKYKGLSNDAKVAYALLKDRYRLSEHTTEQGNDTYVDEAGYIYFVYTVEQLMDVLNLARATVTKVKKALEKAGLLEQDRQGQGKANRLYLLEPTFEESEGVLKNNVQNEDKEVPRDVGGVEKFKNCTSKSSKIERQEVQKLNPIKNDSIKNDSSNNDLKIVNKESHKSFLINLCNEHYAELSVGRWSKKQWNTLVNKFVDEIIEEDREIQYPKAYIIESLQTMAYKYDLRHGRIERRLPVNSKVPFYNWLDERDDMPY
jgi:DNA-binding MarR family transcriptional regulator